jgi:hypothetical protein
MSSDVFNSGTNTRFAVSSCKGTTSEGQHGIINRCHYLREEELQFGSYL